MVKKIFNNYGVSLIECIIVIIIISILVLLWGFYGRDHMRIAITNEGHMFIEKVIAQEKMYRIRESAYLPVVSSVTASEELDIDTFHNKYFKTFTVTVSGNTLYVSAYGTNEGSGITVRGIYDIGVTSGTVFQEFL
ncbi:MAG: prepilin-type N-terminal cleavage/methylation domain-containing protein [Endomicrobiaceae bacterium]